MIPDTPSSAASGMGLVEELRAWADRIAPLGWADVGRERILRATDALEAQAREMAEARAFARKLSDALLKVRPLGGSELFTRVGEVFYADPAYCGGEIDRLRAELHAAKAENIKIKQEKFATTRARDEAMAALREKEERVRVLEGVLGKVERWAESRCPCHNEEPNPCPLCGASVENLESCKSAESTLPRDVLAAIRSVSRRARSVRSSGQHVSGSREQRGNEEG